MISREAGAQAPSLHSLVGESCPAMAVELTKMVHIMFGKVDDQEAAARRYQARRLPHGARRVHQIVQDLMNDNEVSAGVR